MDDWKVIVSRVSGGGAEERWEELAAALSANRIPYSVAFTERHMHALDIARQAVLEGYRKILVAGGDGALHEALCGVMMQEEVPSTEVTLGIIPIGSGNDWARYHQIPSNINRAVEIISRGKKFVQDVVKAETTAEDGGHMVRYMVNIGGLGLDAYVCHLFSLARKRGEKSNMLYYKCLLRAFFHYKMKHFRITADGEDFYDDEALSVALGNGKYCGGGMMQTPDAAFDDGLIDMTVTGRMSKVKFVAKVRTLFNGTIKTLREVEYERAKSFCVEAEPASYVEVDGEICGKTPARFTILPLAINVITNR